jgi:hypothetical protein
MMLIDVHNATLEAHHSSRGTQISWPDAHWWSLISFRLDRCVLFPHWDDKWTRANFLVLLECRIGYAVLNVLHFRHVAHAIDYRKAVCKPPKPLPDQR